MRAKIDVVKRPNDVGNRKSRKTKSETFRAQIGSLYVLADCAVEIRKQAATRHLTLTLRLPQSLGRARFTEVIGKSPPNGVAQTEFSIERHFGAAGRASRVRALHLHVWIQRVYGSGGAWRRGLRSLYGAAGLRCTAGERKLRRRRALRGSRRRAELREDRSSDQHRRRDHRCASGSACAAAAIQYCI